MSLDNTTVIIPAHNRPERLRRLLDYYSSTDIKVLVTDSSNEPYPHDLNYPNVVYRFYPRATFLLKLKAVLPLIDTKYVLYCADDDFTVPEGIEKVTRFLDEHPDYSVAQGHYLTFEPSDGNGGIVFTPRYIRYFDNQISAQTARQRLELEKCMYAPTLYGVTRSDIFKRIYGTCFNSDGTLRFSNLFLAEEFFIHATLIKGKYATIPCFYSARENIPCSATNTTVPISEIKTSEKYKDEYTGYLTALAELLAEEDGSSVADASEFIRHISDMPKDTKSHIFKRKVLGWINNIGCLRNIARKRYHQKGLRAVRGMESYPCTFSTPEKEAIIKAVTGTFVERGDI